MLLIDLLHVDMVHMPLVEWIRLDNSIPIGLRLWAVGGIVSYVLALEALDLTQVPRCMAILTVLIVVASIATIGSIVSPITIVPPIAIAIPVSIVVVVYIMVVTIPNMMVVCSIVNMAIPTI